MMPLGTLVLVRDAKAPKLVVDRLESASRRRDQQDAGPLDSEKQVSVLQTSSSTKSVINDAKDDGRAMNISGNACLQKKGKSKNDEGGNKKKPTCAGQGDNWLCLWQKNNGADTRSGNTCEVQCKDCENFHPKKAYAVCKDGKYDELPDCLQNIQCPPFGSAWKCKGQPEGKKINLGEKCEVECQESGFHPSHAEVKCGEKEMLEPQATCQQGRHCASSGGEEQGWKCQGSEVKGGEEQIPSGKTCKVVCDEKEFEPEAAQATCKDGKYDKEPKCVKPGSEGAGGKSFAVRRYGALSLFVALLAALHQ